ncbi:thiamine pyrophosphate-binding protein [Streptomyces sp. CSDS2]|uniref:thiamine pyrophosphate-binding protein n=1 Tax=Streptomyces sp. CSDS2 TaxID=3055051 RepID=UPI0025AFEDC1|nr:thiamine pyrophosphate-binding protein [Streptomyces sp. CSDS2]MDN3263079.1 thiamine pyrophosphate-binding protein [Streptomyces sp. CSDS2]
MVKVSDRLAAWLRDVGVGRVYGVPGLAVDPLLRALGGGPGVPEFVQARGVESAALMACAEAKLTGRPGCCLAPPGADVLRLLGGLYDAAADRAPVLALVGADPVPRRGGGPAVRHLAAVCVYCEEVSGPELVGDAFDRVVRAALGDRGVASLILPRETLAAPAPPALSGPYRPSDFAELSGSSDPSGSSGPSGSWGSTGATELSDAPELSASSGPSGSWGPSGSRGLSGSSGQPDSSELSGSPGPSGPWGPSGFSGLPGSSGSPGSSGRSGSSGSVGSSGFRLRSVSVGPSGVAVDGVRRAAEVLGGGRAVVVIGNAGRAASGQVVRAARLLGAGVATTALARDALPDDLPYLAGVAGPLGSEAAAALLRDCDTLLLVGAEDLDPALLPAPGRCRIVTVDHTPDDCPLAPDAPAVRVNGDVTACLEALLPLLRGGPDRGWAVRVERTVRAWRAAGETRAHRYFGTSVNPRSVVAELSERLPERAVVTTDSGTALDWWTRHLRLRTGMRSLLSGHLQLPGAAVPYAVAARFAAPDRPVIALVGDGALQGGGLNELITVRRHLDRLAGLPPLVFCVFNNGDLNRLTWQRRAAEGDPLIPLSAEVPALPYARWARLAGLPAVRCDRPRHVGSAWDDALGRRGPLLLEFVVDGETPPDWATAPATNGIRPKAVTRLLGTAG